jgi:hypothetical protein
MGVVSGQRCDACGSGRVDAYFVDAIVGILRSSMPDPVDLLAGKPHVPSYVPAVMGAIMREATMPLGKLNGMTIRDALMCAYALGSVVMLDAGGTTYRLRDIVELEGLLR